MREKKAFTLLELLITIFLGTLLLLLLYQVFGKVAQDFLRFREGHHISLFIKVSEGLRRQLEALDSGKVNIGRMSGSLFYWRNGYFAFVTRFGPAGRTIAIYKNTKDGLIYAELLYTGQRLSPNLFDEAKKMPYPPIYFIPGIKIALLKLKEDKTFKELSSWRGVPSCKNRLVIKISGGFHQRLIPICPD